MKTCILENKDKETLLSDVNWLEFSYWECFHTKWPLFCLVATVNFWPFDKNLVGVGAAESAAAHWNTWRLLILCLGLITFQRSAATSLCLRGWGNKHWLTSPESGNITGLSSEFQLSDGCVLSSIFDVGPLTVVTAALALTLIIWCLPACNKTH